MNFSKLNSLISKENLLREIFEQKRRWRIQRARLPVAQKMKIVAELAELNEALKPIRDRMIRRLRQNLLKHDKRMD